MKTPICDFVSKYVDDNALRLHMPGHKGVDLLGFEKRDITEIDGADSLYQASGIIKESEENAGALFGCDTFYSTEGSSQCIRAMLYLALKFSRSKSVQPFILAGRNVHSSFVGAAALLGIDVEWYYGSHSGSYLSCTFDAVELDDLLGGMTSKPIAVYVTAPDYLGNLPDISSVSAVCHKHGVLLLVDNAHGAYLKFLPESKHPIDFGADICCDSAHKTLPTLTGAAYLHLSKSLPTCFCSEAKTALSLFGSTSPSYLILQSLDAVNGYIADGYPEKLAAFIKQVDRIKNNLKLQGYRLIGDEPLKITVDAKEYGYSGIELANILLAKKIVCEFFDPDFIVLMLTPEVGINGLESLLSAMLEIPHRAPKTDRYPDFSVPERVFSPRETLLLKTEQVSAAESLGRVSAQMTIACPPAVPVVICGERISKEAVAMFEYYGISSCEVIKE